MKKNEEKLKIEEVIKMRIWDLKISQSKYLFLENSIVHC